MHLRSVTFPALIALLAGCSERGGVLIAATLDFGDTPAGLAVERTIVVENVGTGRARITGIASSERLVGPEHRFTVMPVERELAPGGITQIPVTFTALAAHDEPVTAVIRFATDGDPLVARLRGHGVARGLSIDPQPLDFGDVVIGRDRSLDVMVTNTLDVPVELMTALDSRARPIIDNEAGNGLFELRSPVEPSGSLIPGADLLAPGASRAFLIRYTPTPIDGREDRARWTISHCPASACAVDIRMQGRARAAGVTCSPAALELRGSVGEVVQGSVRCVNDTPSRAQLLSVRLDSTATAELSVVPPGSPVLEPGEAVDIEVDFRPVLPRGARRATGLSVEVLDVATRRELGAAHVAVRATAGRAIVAADTTCDAGDVPLGSRGHCLVNVANAGDEPLVISSVVSEDPTFTVANAPSVIPPGATSTIDMLFTPTAAGLAGSRIIVSTNDVLAPTTPILLVGAGVTGPPCSLGISHPTLDFGLVEVGEQALRQVELQNVGATACDIAAIRFSNPDPAYSLVSSGARFTLAPRASRIVTFAFTPTMEGTTFATAEMLVPVGGGAAPVVVLRGRGGRRGLSATPAAVEFGSVPLSCPSLERTVRLENVGTTALRIDGIELEPSSAPSIELVPPALPANLAPGTAVTLVVRLRQPASGDVLGAILVTVASAPESLVVPVHAEATSDPRVEERQLVSGGGPTDVLFIVDDLDGSMGDFLSRGFPTFLGVAASLEVDWQVGVTSAVDAPNLCGPSPTAQPPPTVASGTCGYLARAGASAVVIDANVADPQRVFELAIAPRMGVPFVANASFQAAEHALTEPIRSGWNAGLLRPNASLAVVFASNRDDASPRSVTSYGASLIGARPLGTRVRAFGVVPMTSGACRVPTPRIVDVASALGGRSWSICDTDPAVVLSDLADEAFGATTHIELSAPPDLSTVEVTIDGVRIGRGSGGWEYDAATNSVIFPQAVRPEPGSEVVIRYRRGC